MGGMRNPLLDFTDLPLFDQIRPEHVAAATDELLAECEAALEAVVATDFPADWQALSRTLDCSTEKLSRAWGAVSHLNSVADTPELRAAYNEALPRVTEFWTRLGSDERLYAKYKAIDPATLNPEQQQAHREWGDVAAGGACAEHFGHRLLEGLAREDRGGARSPARGGARHRFARRLDQIGGGSEELGGGHARLRRFSASFLLSRTSSSSEPATDIITGFFLSPLL